MGAIYRNGQKFTTSPNNAEMINYKNTTVASELDSLNSTILNKFDSGQATIPSVSSGSIGHFAVQFSHTFNSTPRVVISQNESQANLYRTGLNISVSNINTSGFNIYYAYNGSAEIGPTLADWIAIS